MTVTAQRAAILSKHLSENNLTRIIPSCGMLSYTGTCITQLITDFKFVGSSESCLLAQVIQCVLYTLKQYIADYDLVN